MYQHIYLNKDSAKFRREMGDVNEMLKNCYSQRPYGKKKNSQSKVKRETKRKEELTACGN